MPKAKKYKSILQSTKQPVQEGHQHPKQQRLPPLPQQRKQQQQQDVQRGMHTGSSTRGIKRRAMPARASTSPKRQHKEEQDQLHQPQWFCRSIIDRQAADAVHELMRAAETQQSGSTIKSLTLAPHVVHKKATFAVTCETLKFLPVLKQLVAHAGLLDKNPQLPEACSYVLAYELLFGQGIRDYGPAESAISKAQDTMRTKLQQLLEDAGVETPEALLSSASTAQPRRAHPRTARVNTLKMSVAAALQWLQQEGYSDARVDAHLPDVLVLPPGTDLHDHALVKHGALILQSKASCMPAHALAPAPGWTVVDCCAAPGNKTTHVAAMVGPPGRVLAFDKDPKRLKRLQHNAERSGAAHIGAQCADFLSLETSDPQFAQVKGVILDPSCSGSGTVVSRMDHLLPRGDEEAQERDGTDAATQKRIEQLARFQEAALRHALSFPALQRLAYSTCSIHQRENEDVVAAVLPHAKELGFGLAPALPAWPRRGLPVVEGSELLVRTDPYEDGTDGFFVAVFERVHDSNGQEQQKQQAHLGSEKQKKRRRMQSRQQQGQET